MDKRHTAARRTLGAALATLLLGAGSLPAAALPAEVQSRGPLAQSAASAASADQVRTRGLTNNIQAPGLSQADLWQSVAADAYQRQNRSDAPASLPLASPSSQTSVTAGSGGTAGGAVDGGQQVAHLYAAELPGAASAGQLAQAGVSAQVESEVAAVGLTWQAQGDQPLTVLGREKVGGTWSQWHSLSEEYLEGNGNGRRGIEPWTVVGASQVQAVVVTAQGQALSGARLEVINVAPRPEDQQYALVTNLLPDHSEAGSTAGRSYAATTYSGTVSPSTADAPADIFAGAAQPSTADGPAGETPNTSGTDNPTEGTEVDPNAEVAAWANVAPAGKAIDLLTRADWGANESWRTWDLKPGAVKAAVVHHTAGVNNYTPEQVPEILRGIYRYHAVSLHWGDIGYNVLVDNFGRAWQGRAGDFWNSQIAGGHAYGVNNSTFGISVLGTYSAVAPSLAAQDTVARVVAYKLRWAGVDPAGTTVLDGVGASGSVPTIIGHRDVPGSGGKTSCPGNAFYDRLPALRQLVAQYYKQGEGVINVPAAAQAPAVPMVAKRISGSTRVATAAAIAASQFPSGAKTIYLARADKYADALAGGALSDGPVLLVSSTSADINVVRNYIAASPATQVIALGGTAAISDWLLGTVAGSKPKARLAGGTRAATAAQIAQRAKTLQPSMTKVYLAEQMRGIDALSAGAISDGPVLLVPTSGAVPAEVSAAIANINPAQVVALGGTAAVSEQVLQAAAGGRATDRIAGATRYETSLAISRYAYPSGADRYFIANALNPVDAVAGGTLSGGPIVLVPPSGTLPSAVGSDIQRINPIGVTALGGPKAVADDLLNQAVSLVKR